MASATVTRVFVDRTIKTFKRKRQGRRVNRKTTKFLLRLPVEYYEIMAWNNEMCGGNLPITQQIVQAIRASLCGCVYTQLVNP